MDTLSNKINKLSPKKRALLEKLMKQKGVSDALSKSNTIEKQARTQEYYPLSSAQQRLWFLEQLGHTGQVFNVHAAIKLNGDIKYDLIEKSFRWIVERHESLRTRFIKIDGKPYQKVSEDTNFNFKIIDLAESKITLSQCINEHRQQSFDLINGPLFTVAIVVLSSTENVLLMAMHHIVSDASSMQILIQELLQIYGKYLDNLEPDLEDLPIHYIDYACWQQKYLNSAEMEKQLNFWKDRLSDMPPYLDMPTDFERPKFLSYRGNGIRFNIPAEVLTQLKVKSKQQNCSMFMLTLTAYAVLLSQYCRNNDISIGTDIANRNNIQIKPLIGFFINQLVLRLKWDGNPSLKELAQMVRKQCLSSYTNQDLPFNYLVEQLNVVRDPSRTPIYQIKFTMENFYNTTLRDDSFELIEWDEKVSQFDLELALKELDGELEGYFRYRTDLFSEDTIKSMITQYTKLIELVAYHDDTLISEINLMTDSQRQSIYKYNENETFTPYDSLIDAILNFPNESRDKISVEYLNYKISYADLLSAVNKLAGYMQDLGVKPHQIIAICMPRSIDLLIAQLAVLRLGACYVPIDIESGEQRISYVLEDSDSQLLILSEQAAGLINSRIKSLQLGNNWRDELKNSNNRHWPSTHEEQLAYIIYTSGSTGKPKGVAVRLKSLSNFLSAMQKVTRISPDDKLLAVTTAAFDISGLELYLPLYANASLVIAAKDELLDSRLLYSAIEKFNITMLQATPATWNGLCAIAKDKLLNLTALCGGEALTKDLYKKISKICSTVINLYGPTETTIWSSSVYLNSSLLKHGSYAPLGRPIDNTKFYIFDRYGKLQLPGIPGELCIDGDGLARGYWNNAKLTAEAFVPNPYSKKPGARLYRTGDCVKFKSDGQLLYLGRYDQQVKVRGYRIEIGEIEAVIKSCSGIRDVCVVDKTDKIGFTALIAFVVSNDSIASSNQDDLKKHLLQQMRKYLPSYMVPAKIQWLESFPLTVNKKIDKLRLRNMAELENISLYEIKTEPKTEIERQVSEIWKKILGVGDVFLEQDFFEFGGHSLLAIHLLDEVESTFERRISLKDFFQKPTLFGIVDALSVTKQGTSAYPTIIPDAKNRYEPFALTDLQQAYLIGRHADFEMGSIATQNYIEIDINNLNFDQFVEAWNIIINRHEMLRAVFNENGQQRILKSIGKYTPEFYDLSGKYKSEKKAFLAKLRDRLSMEALPEKTGPLFKINITKLDGQKYRIHICMDMLISDVFSNFIIFSELDRLYRNKNLELPPIELSFRDYIVAEQGLKKTSLYEKAKQYWLERLENFPNAPDLPLAVTPNELSKQRFVRRKHHILAGKWSELQACALDNKISPTVLLLTAYGQVLGTWSKNKEFSLNLTLFNRLPMHAQVQKIVGDFTSSLLLQQQYISSMPFNERARVVQDQLWKDLDHKIFSGVSVIREMARLSNGSNILSMPIVFTSMLGMGTQSDEYDQGGMTISEDDGDYGEEHYSVSQTSQVWLDHQVVEENGGVTLVWDAVEDLFPQDMLNDMFQVYTDLLDKLCNIDNWSKTLFSIPEKQLSFLDKVNNTKADLDRLMLHELFEQQARIDGQRIAVKSHEIDISYGQLDHWCNNLAGVLLRSGVKPNKLVAIVMRKCWQQVVASLSILKSGSAYLPIDASLPIKRIKEILSDGQCEIILIEPSLKAQLSELSEYKIFDISKNFLEGLNYPKPELDTAWTDIAYVIFTSGSTGKPKGVVIDHRGAVNTIIDINRRFNVTKEDSILAMSSLSFDLSVYDVFGILAVGAAIVLPDYRKIDSPKYWYETLCRNNITIWNTVPALMQLLVDYCESIASLDLGPIKLVMMSGDWIPVDLPDRIKKLSPQCQTISLGGATEASIWSIFYPIDQPTSNLRSIPYGKPLSNQCMHVLDQNLLPCPKWVTGQIYIGGIGVAKGYWNDPDRTSDSFIASDVYGIIYKTGDLGRYIDKGEIEFLGREDNQVKIQGFRVELGEIESTLQQHPMIQTAIVTAYGERQDSKSLVAYIQPANEQDSSDSNRIIHSADERSLFKLEQKGIRRLAEHYSRQHMFDCVKVPNILTHGNNATHDRVDANAKLIKNFAMILGSLRQVNIDTSPLPKYFYPSASSLYPVQLYINIDIDNNNISRGFYYYSSLENTLVRLSGCLSDKNSGAVRLYWLADLDAISPMYPHNELIQFVYLEMGYMQTLIDSQLSNLNLALEHICVAEDEKLEHPLLPKHVLYLAFSQVSENVKHNKKTIDQISLPNNILTQTDLPEAKLPVEHEYEVLKRQSFRKFTQQPLSLLQLSNILTLLTRHINPALEVMIYLKTDRCSNNLSGLYGYGRLHNRLNALDVESDEGLIASLYNQENLSIFEKSAFAIFILDHKGSQGEHYYQNLVEVGRACQNLMAYCWSIEIGVCPIGHINQNTFNNMLDLHENSLMLHGFVGGCIDTFQYEAWSVQDEWDAGSKGMKTIAEYLGERLPSYMVPTVFIPIEKLPLTPNGKVDRNALPKPDFDLIPTTEYEAPSTEYERILTELWQTELEQSSVGINDNFFALGGNSLLAMRIISKISSNYKIDISLRMIFEKPILKELALVLENTQINAGGKFDFDIYSVHDKRIKDESENIYPLSYGQQHIFAYSQLNADQSAYNITTAMQVEGNLNKASLELTLQTILDRHDALRTRFTYCNGQLYQVVDPQKTLCLEKMSVNLMSEKEVQTAIKQFIQSESEFEFDMFAGPMMRCCLIELNKQRYVIVINVHHIIADFLSMDILAKELVYIYNELLNYQSCSLNALPLQFPDFVLWQKEFMQSDAANKQIRYWKNALEDLPDQILPYDQRFNAKLDEKDGWLKFHLSDQLSKSLKSQCQRHDITMFIIGLAAVQQLLFMHTGQQDVAIGTPVSTRFNPDLEEVVGLLLNTLIIRINSNDYMTGTELLLQVKETVIKAFDNKDVPIEYIQQSLIKTMAGRSSGTDSLYRVRFVYRKIENDKQAKDGLKIKELEIDRSDAKFDLLISLNETNEQLFGEFEYKGTRLKRSVIEEMNAQLQNILMWLSGSIDIPLKNLHKMLTEFKEKMESKSFHRLKGARGSKLKNLTKNKQSKENSAI